MLLFEDELEANTISTAHITEHNPDDGECSGGANLHTGNLESLQHKNGNIFLPPTNYLPTRNPVTMRHYYLHELTPAALLVKVLLC